MTVLSHQSIQALCAGPHPLIDDPEPKSIRSASYDLRIGSEYYVADLDKPRPPFPRTTTTTIGTLGGGLKKILEIGANEVVLILAHEKVQMPNNLVGHLSLKLELLLKGLIMSSQSQVDAGYRGPIYALLYNLSDVPVTVHHLDPFLRIEFALLDADTGRPYDGVFKPDFTLGDVVKGRIRSSLSAMEERLADVERRVFRIAAGSVIAGLLAIIGILGPVQGQASDARADARQAEERVATNEQQLQLARAEVTRLDAQIAQLTTEVEGLRGALTPSPPVGPPTTTP